MDGFYNRDGEAIDMFQWSALLSNREYKRVAETTLPDGRWVSTVWLGLDHGYGAGSPLIFETMVFRSKDDLEDLAMDRYSTEDEAKTGHQEMVDAALKGTV